MLHFYKQQRRYCKCAPKNKTKRVLILTTVSVPQKGSYKEKELKSSAPPQPSDLETLTQKCKC